MIPKEILKKVRQIEIRTGRLVNDVFAGRYESIFKGRGMEFHEVREYVPGDDIRSIDWNVTARAGKPYIKRYVEERELTVMLLVDLSASGNFATKNRLKNEGFPGPANLTRGHNEPLLPSSLKMGKLKKLL